MTNTTIKTKSTHFKTLNPAVNITRKRVFSSVLNKLKYFFTCGLLTTLSFHTVSADNTQKFNKETYLNLSKPYTYNWNNSQSHIKKDAVKTIGVNNIFTGGSFNEVIYGVVTSPATGRVWLDRNLGATQACTSSADAACYGELYQWGRAKDGHESRTSGVISTLAPTITPESASFIRSPLSPFDWTSTDNTGTSRIAAWANGGVNDICPTGFSVPTVEELIADSSGAAGVLIINSATAFSNFLKIPVAGNRNSFNGTVGYFGSYAGLWSRSIHGSSAIGFNITSDYAGFDNINRAYGFSIRCIKD